MQPRIRYAHTSDGVSIAFTVVGEGPPLVFAPQFLVPDVHDEVARPVSFWRPFSDEFAVVLWDMRGFGLSQAGGEHTMANLLLDMDAVVDAAGLGQFDLAAVLTPCHIAIAYAAQHPERVRRMVLWNPSDPGRSPRVWQPSWLRAIGKEDWAAFTDVAALFQYGWERAELAQRQAERMRAHFDAESYERVLDAVEAMDATADAPRVQAPTLCIDDRNFPQPDGGPSRSRASFEEMNERRQRFIRELASRIPHAEYALFKEGNWQDYVPAAKEFLRGERRAVSTSAALASGTAVILFTDIVDSTGLTERMGDEGFRAASRALDGRLRDEIVAAGGAPVEGRTLGDGILAVFASAREAIVAAVRCTEVSGETELRLHVGLHAGDVIREDGNVYGGAVNIAARVCALAEPGEILVSGTVRDLARTSAGVAFADRGEHALKGVAEAVRVFAVAGGG